MRGPRRKGISIYQRVTDETLKELLAASKLAEADLRLAFNTRINSYRYSKGLVAIEAAIANVEGGKQ